MKKRPLLKPVILALAGLFLVNLLSDFWYTRWDLTEDRRFTLAQPSLDATDIFDGPVVIDVLLEGDLPSEFARLQREVRLLLEQFADRNPHLRFEFIDPMEGAENPAGVIQQLQELGLKPASVTTEEDGKVSQELVFPWAMVNYGQRTEKVALLRNQLGASMEERINGSIQNLEYAFADAFTKLGRQERKRVAVLKGNGELEDIFLADYLTSLRDYYNIAPFTLDSVAADPARTLNQLSQFDAALIAKPTEAFSEAEKLVLDQFMVQGGRTLWLIDAVAMDLDSLLNPDGQSVALGMRLNLDDLLFRYGVRLNPNLVADLVCSQIVLATGEGNDSQYSPVPWVYDPMVLSPDNHPINTNLEALRLQFAGSIDTLANDYRKTVLYRSSPRSRLEGTPKLISLDIIGSEPDPAAFGPGNFPLAVLVEGPFQSAYRNRVREVDLPGFLDTGPENKLIIVGDGDLAANQLQNGRPLELGYDPWTNNFYGNKEFLVNAMNYLLEDTGLINIRNKRVSIPLLDTRRISEEKSRWQLLNIGLPLLLVLLAGLGFQLLRKRQYG